MSSSPPPRPWRQRLVRTRDVDEARAVFSSLYTDSTIEPDPGVPFACTLDAVSFDGVNVITGSWPGGARVSAPVIGDRYIFACSAEGAVDVEQAAERFAIVPGRQGLLLSAAGPGTCLHARAGQQGRTVTIERRALDAHFRNLTGAELRGPLQFKPGLDLDSGPGAAVFEIARTFRRETERDGASPLLLAALREALFTSLLVNTEHNASALLASPSRRPAPGCVRRAEEYIEAHAAEAIMLADIAAATGVPIRSLQAAFQANRQTTPMAQLRERRMALARQRLLAAAPGVTIASVVTTLHLGPAGRFSVLYKKRFGESPSETLARARRACGRVGAS